MPLGKYKWISAALCFGGCACVTTEAAASAPACAPLSNTAQTSFIKDGAPGTISSNTATIRIAELLDLHLAAAAPATTLVSGESGAVAFALANTGNGAEAYTLEGHIDGTAAALTGFAVDRDGDGRFDPAKDLRIDSGATTPAIAPGASLPLLALVQGGANTASGTLTVTARAVTGSGAPGSDFAGAGDGGCDAVVGGTTASGTASVTLMVAPGSDTSQISVVKSQSVMAPNGSAIAVRGATITYSIESRFGGSGVVRAVRLADPIPPGTALVPGSIRLDGTALADSAAFDGAAIRVTLGDVPAPAVRTLQFQVIIQ